MLEEHLREFLSLDIPKEESNPVPYKADYFGEKIAYWSEWEICVVWLYSHNYVVWL